MTRGEPRLYGDRKGLKAFFNKSLLGPKNPFCYEQRIHNYESIAIKLCCDYDFI